MRKMGNSFLILFTLILLICASCKRIDQAVERGVQKAALKKMDHIIFNGEKLTEENLRSYAPNLSFKILDVLRNEAEDKAIVKGKVTNSGNKTVSFLKADFVMLSDEGKEIGHKVDLLAHNLPIGDNNRPIRKGSTVTVRIEISPHPEGWDGKSAKLDIIEMAFMQ